MKRIKTKKQSKNEWIGKKISELVRENYPQDQAVAVAISMYDQQFQSGGRFGKNVQTLGQGNLSNLESQVNSNFGKNVTKLGESDLNIFSENPKILQLQSFLNPTDSTYGTPQQQLQNSTRQFQIGGIYDKEYMAMTPTQEQLKSGQFIGDRFGTPQAIDYKFNPQMQAPQAPMPYADYAQKLAQNNPIEMQGYGQYNVDPNFKPSNVITPQAQNPLTADAGSGYQTDEQGNAMDNEKKFQFAQLYGGGDPMTGAYRFGEGVQNKDPLAITLGALSTLAPLARAGFTGAGNAKRSNYVKQDTMEKYREGLKPAPQMKQDGGYYNNYFQIGGESDYPATRQDSIALKEDSLRMLAEYQKRGYKPTNVNFPNTDLEQSFLDIQKRQTIPGRKGTTEVIRNGVRKAEKFNPSDYRQDVNENQFRQREAANGVLNMDIVPSLYDKRVQPTSYLKLMGEGAGIQNDGVNVPYYGDMQISPENHIVRQPVVNSSVQKPPVKQNTKVTQPTYSQKPPSKTNQYREQPQQVMRDDTRVGTSFTTIDPKILRKASTIQLASFQDGGMAGQMPPQEEQQAGQEQQLMMQVAEALQGGADPNQILQQLVEMGIPAEQATQLIESIMQQMQGGAPQEQAPQEEMYEMGGTKKKSLPKLLTGEYTAEKDNVEEEDIVAEVEGAEYIKTPQGEITQVLGKSHAQGGVQLTEEQLPENSEILSDHLKVTVDLAKTLKDLGVTTKDTYAKALDKWTAKSGLKKIVEEQEEMIKKLEAQSKLLVERPSSKDTIKLNTTLLQEEISELEKEKEPLLKEKQAIFDQLFAAQEASKPKEKEEVMENGGTFNNDIIVKYAKKHGISPERANELVNEYKNGGVTKYQGGGRFDDFYKQSQRLGYTGKKQIGDIQQWMAKNQPDEVVSYFTKSGQPLTAKHVDILKKDADWAFVMAGVSPNKPSAEYTTEEKNKLFEGYNQGLGNKSGEYDKEFLLQGFTDNKWDWRAPVIGIQGVPVAGMAKTTIQAPVAANPFLPTQQASTPQAEIAAQKEDKFSNLDNAQRARTGLMALPNQYAQLPDPLQGALKLEYRPNLLENQNITADPIIAEIRRSEQNAMQSVQNLPDEQRAAAAAQIQANTQEQLNKVMSQVQGQNLQSNAAIANQNAQILNNSQDINNRYLSDYENKIYKAQAITDADRRNYFLHNQKVDLENFNAINKANLYNQLADNYQLTDRGLELYNSPQLSYDGTQAIKPAEDKKKKPTKKDGGRFKKRNS